MGFKVINPTFHVRHGSDLRKANRGRLGFHSNFGADTNLLFEHCEAWLRYRLPGLISNKEIVFID